MNVPWRLRATRCVSTVLAALALCACGSAGGEPESGGVAASAGGAEPEPALGLEACEETGVARLADRYDQALQEAAGDRGNAGPRGIVDASIGALVECFDAPTTTDALREGLLGVMARMHDARATRVFVGALEWRVDETEVHAMLAARGLRDTPLDDDAEVVIAALDGALARIVGTRGVDNRMRIEIIRTLGATRDPRAVPALVRTARLRSDAQNFLINRLAFEQLGAIADPSAIPTLIEGLLLFDLGNPAIRANDVAAGGLAAIGAPALRPLLAALALENQALGALAEAYLAAVRARDPHAAATMSADSNVVAEVSYALGVLGFPAALGPLLSEVDALDPGETATSVETDPVDFTRAFSAALALVSLVLVDDDDLARRRTALLRVFQRAPDASARMQLLVAMQHCADPGLLPFFLAQAGPSADPDARILAARAALVTGLAEELVPLEMLIAAEPPGDVLDAFDSLGLADALTLSRTCGRDVTCWAGHLRDEEPARSTRAAAALARLGRHDATVLTALVAALDVSVEEALVEIFYAIDIVAHEGSASAVTAITEMEDGAAGTPLWAHIGALASRVRARLVARAAAED